MEARTEEWVGSYERVDGRGSYMGREAGRDKTLTEYEISINQNDKLTKIFIFQKLKLFHF
jgi:hypothetical protein